MELILTHTQLFTSQGKTVKERMDWSCLHYLRIIVMRLSSVWTLFLMAPMHCWRSIGEQIMYCLTFPNLFRLRNKLIYISDGLRVSTFSANFHLLVIYSFEASAFYEWALMESVCPTGSYLSSNWESCSYLTRDLHTSCCDPKRGWSPPMLCEKYSV